jgi:hypothetical protein
MMLSTQVDLGTAATLGVPLKNGDVIAGERSSKPPNIGTLLEAANRARIYTQSDLATNAPEEKNWQSTLTPPSK